jgi:dihydrofolate reductase
MITLIAAYSKNKVIGIDNKLPWHLPEDLKRFKALTLGKNIVMGRKTFESIGRPLPGRTNIVLSKSGFKAEGVVVYDSIPDIINDYSDIIVIGGEQIYKTFLLLADVLEITEIDKEFEGDAFFPDFNNFFLEKREEHIGLDFNWSYKTYTRNKFFFI